MITIYVLIYGHKLERYKQLMSRATVLVTQLYPLFTNCQQLANYFSHYNPA